jgi:hypothetical protein
LRLSDSREVLLEMCFKGAAHVEVLDSTWHPEFGVALANRCVVATLEGQRLVTLIHAGESA